MLWTSSTSTTSSSAGARRAPQSRWKQSFHRAIRGTIRSGGSVTAARPTISTRTGTRRSQEARTKGTMITLARFAYPSQSRADSGKRASTAGSAGPSWTTRRISSFNLASALQTAPAKTASPSSSTPSCSGRIPACSAFRRSTPGHSPKPTGSHVMTMTNAPRMTGATMASVEAKMPAA